MSSFSQGQYSLSCQKGDPACSQLEFAQGLLVAVMADEEEDELDKDGDGLRIYTIYIHQSISIELI